MQHCFGGTCVGVVKEMMTHYMLAVLSWWEINGWPTSGSTSMDRNSADPAAQALKTKMLAERTSVEFLGFPEKPEAKS